MPAIENRVVIKALEVSEVIEVLDNGINNGGTTSEERRRALGLILGMGIGSDERVKLLEVLEKAWRKDGDVPDPQLDTANLKTA